MHVITASQWHKAILPPWRRVCEWEQSDTSDVAIVVKCFHVLRGLINCSCVFACTSLSRTFSLFQRSKTTKQWAKPCSIVQTTTTTASWLMLMSCTCLILSLMPWQKTPHSHKGHRSHSLCTDWKTMENDAQRAVLSGNICLKQHCGTHLYVLSQMHQLVKDIHTLPVPVYALHVHSTNKAGVET